MPTERIDGDGDDFQNGSAGERRAPTAHTAHRSLLSFISPRYWPTWLLLLWMRAAALAPPLWAIRRHKTLGRWVGILLLRRVHTARRNLELCFPELSEPEIDSLLVRHFEALGACLCETAIAWFAPPGRLHGLLEVEGLQHVKAALDANRGVMLFTGHFTALEVTGPLLAALDLPLAFMFSHRNNALLDEMQKRRRARIAVSFFSRRGVRAMLKSLRENCVVWYAADQYYRGSHARLVRFFHEPAMTNTAVSRLARLSTSPVVPFFYRRRADDSGYVLTFHAPLENFPSDDPVQDTRRLVEYLEQAIRAAPEQYLWNHKRYRGRPSPLPDVYARPKPGAAGAAPGKAWDHAEPPAETAAPMKRDRARSRSGAWTAAGFALLLLTSRLAGAFDALWGAADASVHRALSAVFQASQSTSALWARVGERWFDDLALLTLLVVFVHRFMRGRTEDIRRGITVGFGSLGVLLLFTLPQLLLPSPQHFTAPGEPEAAGPFAAFARLAEHLLAALSHPGGVTVALLVIAWLWGRAAGKRLGFAVLGLAGIVALPYLASGSYRVSDLFGVAAPLALLSIAALTGTRLGPILLARADRMGCAVHSGLTRLAQQLAGDEPPFGSLPGQLMRGVCIGAAQLVPGVGGGSAAFVLGVYQRLMRAIARLDAQWIRLLLQRRFVEALRRMDILFVAPIALGIIAAPVIFSRAVPLGVLIAELPEMTYGLLFGFIAASLVSLLSAVGKRHVASYGWLVAGVALGCSAAIFVPAVTPSSTWSLFLYGSIAVTAMLMPGLSGAVMLLILGKYAETIDALQRFDLAFLLPLAAGALAGAIVFSKLVTRLLERHRAKTMLAMAGVLGGSLLVLWPFQEAVYLDVAGEQRLVGAIRYFPQTLDRGVLIGTAMMLVGVLAYRLLERAAPRARPAGATTS